MIQITDNRTRQERFNQRIIEGLQACKDVKAQLKLNKEEIMKIAKERGDTLTCKYCKKDITGNYDVEEYENHLWICENKLGDKK